MKYRAYIASGLLSLSMGAMAVPQQSLLSTLTQDTSSTQSLNEQYYSPVPDNMVPKATFFDNYKNPNSSRVVFSTPSGLYRHLCTSCVYDTQYVQCLCQDKEGQDPINTYIKVGDCQQITVNNAGQLMCLDQYQAKHKSA